MKLFSILNSGRKIIGPQTRRRGSTIVEAAFVFPFLIALTFGSIEFGHFFFVKHSLQGAAREGARAGISPGSTNTQVTNAVAVTMNSAGFKPEQYTVAIRNADDTANVDVANATPATSIRVIVSAPWSNVGIRPMGIISTTQPVVGQTVMRKE